MGCAAAVASVPEAAPLTAETGKCAANVRTSWVSRGSETSTCTKTERRGSVSLAEMDALATRMEFPMYVMSMDEFLKLKVMRPHLELLAEGLIGPWRPVDGPVNFLSHQWLGFSHPDPAGQQLQVMQECFKIVLEGKLPFRTDKDWELYCKTRDYKESVGDLSTEVFSQEDFIATIRDGCVWLDFAGVPQVGIFEDAVDIKDDDDFRDKQQRAVNSIPAYCESSTNMWVMVPPCMHVDLGVECNFATWKRRGWCRAEDWSNEFSLASRRPLIVESARDVWVEDFAVKMTTRGQRPCSALNGDFTCCRLNHCVNGNSLPCDKLRIREVVRQALDHKLSHLLAKGDLLHYAWSLMLRPALLSDSLDESAPLDIPNEDMLGFLKRYGFKEDVEGKDTPAHFVFFPLFCAATEGNLEATKALIEAKADVKRRLLGQGTGCLEAAALSGHVNVCKCLLQNRAELEDAAPLDGRTALEKAAEGGAIGVVEMLLEMRANTGARTNEQRTPLMSAAQEGHKEIVQLLLEARSDPLAVCANSMTAEDYATGSRQDLTVERIRQVSARSLL